LKLPYAVQNKTCRYVLPFFILFSPSDAIVEAPAQLFVVPQHPVHVTPLKTPSATQR
jgi:hypothetical protein